MTIDDIIKSLKEKLITLPDQVGLAKCAGFYLLYQGLETLNQAITEERTKYDIEIKALKERLKELEERG